ncbi:hypothetical protein G4B88_009096 [Cannabis sativa]|uniref:NADP-dependent oxidoreductase domain-containing protein n=1 Tax=Cannabis sativa TaxID=3483 RepID=A0A7J6HSE3_CANSA|nr:hypothetical protein G4B88_009096 [Cannabis sativa]
MKPGEYLDFKKEDLVGMDFKCVWESMEECQNLGLTKSIGVSNFSSKKLQTLLATAKIPPALNQVEMNPVWQQKKLRKFCQENGILITAYSPLGGNKEGTWRTNRVMDSDVLKQIANSKGKTIAQSFNKERMKQNIDILDWSLSSEELEMIDQIPQQKGNPAISFISNQGPFKSVEDLWDELRSSISSSCNNEIKAMPLVGMGTSSYPPTNMEKAKSAIVEAIKVGKDVKSLPVERELIEPLDIKSVWEGMEECKRLGLTRDIGVSNFTCQMLHHLLSIAKIPPALNQVEMSPIWQQKKLREFCNEKGIHITAYSPLGAFGTQWGDNSVIECDVLQEIANSKGKTTAQIALRWVYEQGVSLVAKSYNKERMRTNLDIFDWSLTHEESHKIAQIPQRKTVTFASILGPHDLVLDIDQQL